jgi:hypothetical protein
MLTVRTIFRLTSLAPEAWRRSVVQVSLSTTPHLLKVPAPPVIGNREQGGTGPNGRFSCTFLRIDERAGKERSEMRAWHIPAGPGPGSGRADGSLAGSLPPFGQRSLARRPVGPEGKRCRRVRRFDLMPGISRWRAGPPVFICCSVPLFPFRPEPRRSFWTRVAARLASGGHPRTGQGLL